MKIMDSWIKAIAGLMIMIFGGMIPSAILIPNINSGLQINNLPSSWQVSGLLICAIICGPRSAIIATSAYLTIGLFFLPIFHGGGSTGYIIDPDFGYLLGFIPASWLTGKLAQYEKKPNLLNLSLYSFIGVITIHILGFIYLILGTFIGVWQENLIDLILIHSIIPIISQLILVPAVGILTLSIRFLLLSNDRI